MPEIFCDGRALIICHCRVGHSEYLQGPFEHVIIQQRQLTDQAHHQLHRCVLELLFQALGCEAMVQHPQGATGARLTQQADQGIDAMPVR